MPRISHAEEEKKIEEDEHKMRDEEKDVMREPKKRKKLEVFIKKIRDDDQGVRSGFKGYQSP
jgi:hypothetical protein